MILETALICLSLNIYHESRGEPIVVQQAVAQVTMNRAQQDPQNVCKEVFRPYQFSWANKLSKETRTDPYKVVAKRVKKPEGKEWQRSLQIARQALNGDFIRKFKGATHFYNINTDNPKWKERLIYIAQAGPFILMKLKDT